jgi:Na+-translocating ferredoxin:NAD+ oxidoreductase RnfG subunit
MKNLLNKHGLILSLSLILVIIFVFGGMYSRYMVNQMDVHVEERVMDAALALTEDGDTIKSFDSAGSEATYQSPTGETYTPTLNQSYLIFDASGNQVAYAYVIETIGNSEGFKAVYVISSEDDTLLGVEVIEHNETINEKDKYFNALDDNFYNQFEDKNLDVIDFKIDAVAGATNSSDALDTGMKYARELYDADTDFEIITVMLSIDTINYNYDLGTVNDYTYIVNITFGLNDDTAVVGLDNDFAYVSTISGTEPSNTEIEAMPQFVESALVDKIALDASVKYENYDASSQTWTIRVSGYSSEGITLDIILNATEDAVSNINFNATSESYDNAYNDGYSGGAVPEIENNFINQYNSDGTIIDAVAGATITSNALISAFQWIDGLDSSLNGGN